MRMRTVFVLSVSILVLFAVGAWYTVFSSQLPASLWSRMPENQTVTGKITSVGDAEFSVEAGKKEKARAVRFQIDENTRIDGRLIVGAQAMVEYQNEQGSNFAIHVVVTQASRMIPSWGRESASFA